VPSDRLRARFSFFLCHEQAIDDKGLTSITFKVFTSDGNLVQEQELSDLGKIWNGTTQTFLLEFGKYKVVAQATDTAETLLPKRAKDLQSPRVQDHSQYP